MFARAIALTALVCAAATPAFAVGKIYAPYVEQGELEVEYFGNRTFDGDDAKDDAQKHEFSVGYGVTDRWFTELYAIYEKEPGESTDFEAVEWENIFQLTQQGEYWADFGLLAAYEWTPEGGHADEIELGLLASKDTGRFSHILNVLFEGEVGEGREGSVEVAANWSTRYRWNPMFEPGIEFHNEFGAVNESASFDDEAHSIGPVATGTLPVGFTANGHDKFGYRLGYLFGISDASPDGTLVWELEYELRF